jgi:hypothetical protein
MRRKPAVDSGLSYFIDEDGEVSNDRSKVQGYCKSFHF